MGGIENTLAEAAAVAVLRFATLHTLGVRSGGGTGVVPLLFCVVGKQRTCTYKYVYSYN